MNYEAVEQGKNALVQINIPSSWATATDDDNTNTQEPEFITNILRPINAQEGDKLRFVFNESFLTFRKISGDADLSLSWQKVSSNNYGGDRNLKNTISIGIWRDDYNPNENDSISDKIEILSGWKDYEYTFHSSGWFYVRRRDS